jgi:hypothetical protein
MQQNIKQGKKQSNKQAAWKQPVSSLSTAETSPGGYGIPDKHRPILVHKSNMDRLGKIKVGPINGYKIITLGVGQRFTRQRALGPHRNSKIVSGLGHFGDADAIALGSH